MDGGWFCVGKVNRASDYFTLSKYDQYNSKFISFQFSIPTVIALRQCKNYYPVDIAPSMHLSYNLPPGDNSVPRQQSDPFLHARFTVASFIKAH